MQPVLIIFFILAIPAIVILVPLILRSLERRHMLEAAAAATEKGLPFPTELVSQLLVMPRAAPRLPVAERDLRRGVLLLGLALGFVVLGLGVYAVCKTSGVEEGLPAGIGVASAAAIPGLIGLAYLVLWRLGRGAT